MEIEMVHTTGSPGRHDSDSDPSYCDRKRSMKSTSEMALHRKQSRRCKKQMSERQRRKRMNNSMDKLGLLVYGKTFQDGLKVDKATLLKDAYEKLQTMKNDYHKGYETAITSTHTFLQSLHSCPQEVKDALTGHLNNTLKVNLQRCHSVAAGSPSGGAESESDSCSPQPKRSMSSLEGLAASLEDFKNSRVVSGPLPSRKIFDASPAADSSSQHTSHKLYTHSPAGSPSLHASSEQYAGHSADTPSLHSSSKQYAGHSADTPSLHCSHKLYTSPADSSSSQHSSQCNDVPVDSSSLLTSRKLFNSPVSEASPHKLHRMYPNPAVDSRHQSSPGFCVSGGTASRLGERVGSVGPEAAYRVSSSSTRASPQRTVVQVAPFRKSSTSPAEKKPNTEKVSAVSMTTYSTPTPSVTHTSLPHPNPVWNFAESMSGDSTRLRRDFQLLNGYPHPFLFPSSTPSSSTPKISPYVTSYAPQNPLYLDSTPSPLVYGVSELVYSGTPPYPALPTPLSARLGGATRADDSGYMSPGVPSPYRVGSGYGGCVKKRYLREVVQKAREVSHSGESDEENDREVEQVFSKSGTSDSEGLGSHSE